MRRWSSTTAPTAARSRPSCACWPNATISVLDLPTAFWHELVLFLYEERAALPPCVRLVVIGGERVDPTRLRQWRDLDAGHVRLLNTYGCTETTMITHAVQLCRPRRRAEVAADGAEAPLGRPLPTFVTTSPRTANC